MKFASVAFDLDGTLYPNIGLYSRLVPFILKEPRLLIAMGKARKRLRETSYCSSCNDDFYDLQARVMGEVLNLPAEKAKEMTENLIYRAWEPLFRKINLFPHVRETLNVFREKGIKLGLLSDFPPEAKLQNLSSSLR